LAWLLYGVIFVIAGETLFRFFGGFLPIGIVSVAHDISLTATVTVFGDYKPVLITASAGGALGLVIWLLLFLKFGVEAVFKLPEKGGKA